jgi:hypothetical protein
MWQAVLNRLEPGKITIRDTNKKRVAIVKPTANQCIGNTSNCRYIRYMNTCTKCKSTVAVVKSHYKATETM